MLTNTSSTQNHPKLTIKYMWRNVIWVILKYIWQDVIWVILARFAWINCQSYLRCLWTALNLLEGATGYVNVCLASKTVLCKAAGDEWGGGCRGLTAARGQKKRPCIEEEEPASDLYFKIRRILFCYAFYLLKWCLVSMMSFFHVCFQFCLLLTPLVNQRMGVNMSRK